jgi:hypothetical protein
MRQVDARSQYNNLGRIQVLPSCEFFKRNRASHLCDFCTMEPVRQCYTPGMRMLIASIVVAFVLGSVGFTALGADVSGNWSAAVTLDAGSGTAKFTFKQTGDKLTGTYTGQVGTANITGTVKGSDVEWSFDSEQAGKISYKGTLGEDGKITGTVQYGQLGGGKFTAEKDK